MLKYEDSSSDDVPYLPPTQFKQYEQQQQISHPPSARNSAENLPPEGGQRNGRSYFTEEELQELDLTSIDSLEQNPTCSTVPRPPSHTRSNDHEDITDAPVAPAPNFNQLENAHRNSSFDHRETTLLQPSYTVSWGRRFIGLLLIFIPAVLFSAAVHFVDWSMSDFQLFSASFFIFQGILWPSFGILVSDYLCVAKTSSKPAQASISKVKPKIESCDSSKTTTPKWLLAVCVLVHANLSAAILIFQLLSIQRLNISVSLALSFGFDVIVVFIRYMTKYRQCSLELVFLSLISYCGYGVIAIPAFTSNFENVRNDSAIGVGASIGVMLLSIPATLLLAYLRKKNVSESVIGTSFSFFGCIQSVITKEIMGSTLGLRLEGKAIGWAAGLISVVFLGTIFLFLESRLSALIWKRDEDNDKQQHFSSITRTRITVFVLSSIWEFSRQGFRESVPVFIDILGGFLVVSSFLLAGAFEAWSNSRWKNSSALGDRSETKHSFCAFVPWLFKQEHTYNFENEKR